MSLITSSQPDFEIAYGTAGATISFATLLGSQRRVDALSNEQLLHPTLPALTMIRSITGAKIVDVYSHAFDTDEWEIGSTNKTIGSRRPVIRWNYDLSVGKLPEFTYLWLIAPTSAPFSMLTTAGYYGVIPESATEEVFFFSAGIGVYSLSYNYAGGHGWGTWQGASATWQGETVTW